MMPPNRSFGRLRVMTFQTVKKMGDWMPIRDCPGRFVLRGASVTLSVGGLLGHDTPVYKYTSPKVPDVVWIARFDDGGTISYCRPDQTWLHTLCTPSGFSRRLEQLEISLNVQSPDQSAGSNPI